MMGTRRRGQEGSEGHEVEVGAIRESHFLVDLNPLLTYGQPWRA